ncbi:histidinol-phosphatase HisJ family protein [Caloranaerobacter ferrireducens]|uniref:histidinol-phosphatase HisJ family protein n=1 Tax=Caloranaerobacter ferrireducens TaxID=1323370 RepID=UPI00084DED97|nr:histidinol-phosphatase HisJ family protein [Caloranaerobacter ferrireducens]
MYDFHVHSSFSGDCKYTMENMLKGALKKGVKQICFTDHLDFEYGNDLIDFVFDTNDYFKEINRLKYNYKGIIDVLSGVEIGMQPHLADKKKEFIKTHDFDFVIMSIHTAKGQSIHEGTFFKNKNVKDVYYEYYQELLFCINALMDFDVIGHINLIERHEDFMERTLELKEYSDIIETVLKRIIDLGKGIEINTSGIRYGIGSFHPNTDILKLYRSLGGEIITFGSDAHKPEDVCAYYKEAIELLKSIGYRYIAIYKNRKPQFIKIE